MALNKNACRTVGTEFMRWTLLLIASIVPVVAADDDARSVDDQVHEILRQADIERLDAITRAEQDYRAAVAKAFKYADRIEVCLLDFSMGRDPVYEPKNDDSVFYIKPDNGKSKVLKSVNVAAADMGRWRAAAGKMYSSRRENGSAGCHFPIHGLRIYARETLLVEISFCWKCNNYQFTDHWGYSGGVALGDDADDLKALLHSLMPIPEKEKLRLEAGPKPNWKGGIF